MAENDNAMIELECLAASSGCDKMKEYLMGLLHFVIENHCCQY